MAVTHTSSRRQPMLPPVPPQWNPGTPLLVSLCGWACRVSHSVRPPAQRGPQDTPGLISGPWTPAHWPSSRPAVCQAHRCQGPHANLPFPQLHCTMEPLGCVQGPPCPVSQPDLSGGLSWALWVFCRTPSPTHQASSTPHTQPLVTKMSRGAQASVVLRGPRRAAQMHPHDSVHASAGRVVT